MSSESPARIAPRRRASLRARLCLLAFGSMLGAFFAETGARVLAYQKQQAAVADLERLAAQPGPEGEVVLDDTDTRLGRLVRLGADPRIVYEFVPGLRARYLGQRCEFNSAGFRGAEWPAKARTPGTIRIAGLGDSVMFGWAVAEPDCFLRVLERDLQRNGSQGRVEVLNTGVPGYNTAMEVETFEQKVAPYRPDIVLIDYVGNDTDLPNLIANQVSPLTLTRSFAWDYVRRVLGRPAKIEHTPLQTAPWSGNRFESDPDRVPPAYRDMVGEAGVQRALRRLHDLSLQQGFHLAVTCHYEVPPFVRTLCAELGVPLIENRSALQKHLGLQGRTEADYLKSDLVISETDPHPSPIAHRLFGEQIAAFLQKSGWLAEPPAPTAK